MIRVLHLSTSKRPQRGDDELLEPDTWFSLGRRELRVGGELVGRSFLSVSASAL